MADEFKIIESQEQLDAIIKSRLEREKSKYSDQIEDLTRQMASQKEEAQKQIAELTQSLSAFKEEKEGFNQTLAERDAKIKEYELSSVKTQIAHELGLSFEAVSFIQGANEDEIRKSAESLKELVSVKSAPLANSEPVITSDDATRDVALRSMLREMKK